MLEVENLLLNDPRDFVVLYDLLMREYIVIEKNKELVPKSYPVMYQQTLDRIKDFEGDRIMYHEVNPLLQLLLLIVHKYSHRNLPLHLLILLHFLSKFYYDNLHLKKKIIL